MKPILILFLVLTVAACSTSRENDPVYQALKATPPTTIPEHHLAKLRKGRFSCDVFEEGTRRQYMTCWWPSGRPPTSATLSYYGGGLRRPSPENIIAPGGAPVSGFLPL